MTRAMSLASAEDKRSKGQIFLAEPYKAAKYLNLQRKLQVDSDGYPSLQGVNPDNLYYTRDTLRGTEVLKVVESSYPSPDGNDCYNDKKLWEAAKAIGRIKGRMLLIDMKKILEVVKEPFDMIGYMYREEDGVLAPLCAIGRMYIDGINLCTMEVDNIRQELQIMYQHKPRTYEEVETLLEKLKWTVRALEKGQGKAIHEEEQSVLKSLVSNHMRNEHKKAFPNEAIRAATNEMMVRYSRLLEIDPGKVSLESFTNEWLRMWRRISSPSVVTDEMAMQIEQLEEQEERQKAMAASIDQIRAEAKAKEGGKGGPTRQGTEEMIMMRKELSDMKSQFNQLRQEIAQLVREQMKGCGGKFNGRKGMVRGTTIKVDGKERTGGRRTSNKEVFDPMCSARRRSHRRRKER